MGARERQTQVIQRLIAGSLVLLKIDNVQQVGDERPDNHMYSLTCRCGGWVHIMLEQGKDAEWEAIAEEKHRQHIAKAHSK